MTEQQWTQTLVYFLQLAQNARTTEEAFFALGRIRESCATMLNAPPTVGGASSGNVTVAFPVDAALGQQQKS